VYPRSLDFEVLSTIYQLAAGPSSFAKTLRLMAGIELATEGFKAGQVGSSAMPHKVNSRSCERINGLRGVLAGYLVMAGELAGDQWNEGDVSCSVVRRVALPGAMFALDGLLETFATVLAEMEVFPGTVAAERERTAPFLATTTVLMEAVKRGRGREAAHAAIRSHALEVVESIRAGTGQSSDLLSRLSGDPRIGLTRSELTEILRLDERFVGAALAQADSFIMEVQSLIRLAPESAGYQPEEIL
jgi:adenylosuccinate lyase